MWAIFICIIYSFIIYIGFPIIGRQIIKLTYSFPLIYPIVSFYFYRVGLCSTHFVLTAGHVDQRWASDQGRDEYRAWIT